MGTKLILAMTIWVGGGAGAAAAQTPPPAPAPLELNLAQALARARANSADFQAALAGEGIAQAQRTQAQAGLLPSLSYHDDYIYTEHNIFVANDGPHEYVSQGDIHEELNFGSKATLRRAEAGATLARAEAEIASRGLAGTVIHAYYSVLADAHKLATAQQALANAQTYLSYSQDLERDGEAAHADVIKAELEQARQRGSLTEAQLALEQARLDLSVLLFADFNQNFTLADDLGTPPPLPPEERLRPLAGPQAPQLAAAQAAVEQARQQVSIARASLLPSASVDYYYGLDAHQFAVHNKKDQDNLGNSVMVMLTIPIFDWGTNRAQLGEAELERQQALRELSQAQRQRLADFESFYAAAQAAQAELASLASARSLAGDSLRLTALSYRDGETTILDLVDAEDTLTAASDAYADGQLRYRDSLARLQTLTGPF